jgi:nifR3 family TIM-barrel protein
LSLPIANGNFENNTFRLPVPVVLAPMAGITNMAFRTLCREQGAGLFVSEMVTARAVIEEHPETLRLMKPAPGESPRSVQLYGVDPRVISRAATYIGDNNLADHIDLNFGCPVPKVTRRGGGSALPFKQNLFRDIVTSAVKAAAPYGIPVTVKMRIGIDYGYETYLTAAQSAADAGVAWVALHARYAAQMYEGKADWSAITRLVEHLAPTGVPVLGNGDIWSGSDGVAMMRETGCAGVVVGRGCLGRPWLFADLAHSFKNLSVESAVRDQRPEIDGYQSPDFAQVRAMMIRHAQLLIDFFDSEGRAMRDFRKHIAWYLKGFSVSREIRPKLGMVSSLGELEYLLSLIENQPYPSEISLNPRGRTSHGRTPTLPDGWLNDPFEIPEITIDDSISGG